MYGKNSKGYFLRPLGILHAWFGLVVWLPNTKEDLEKKLEDI